MLQKVQFMSSNQNIQAQVMAELGKVIEPELHRDIVSLNMVRDLSIEGSKVGLTLMLTTPACPLKDQIETEVRQAVLRVPGITDVSIKMDASVPSDRRVSGQLQLNIKNLIAVSSGKGGVGKSTIAANLAIALRQSGAAVGLMDADILGPNLPMMMGIDRLPPTSNEKVVPAEAYGVKIMSMGFLVDASKPVIWRGPMIHSAIRQFFTDIVWGPLDYMIIDLPPGTGDAQLSLAQSVPLAGVIIVTQPQQVALGDALRGLAMFEQVNVPILGVVENMSGDFFGSGGGARLAEQRGVPFLGSIPLDPQVRIGGDNGKPIVVLSPDSPAAQALTHCAHEVAARISVLSFQQPDNELQLTPTG
jgi:ATP-binding protein involved in chromosome partitioning